MSPPFPTVLLLAGIVSSYYIEAEAATSTPYLAQLNHSVGCRKRSRRRESATFVHPLPRRSIRYVTACNFRKHRMSAAQTFIEAAHSRSLPNGIAATQETCYHRRRAEFEGFTEGKITNAFE